MIYIDDIAIMENFQTPEFPYRVIMMFPYELNKEEIFQNNLSHILSDLKDLIEEHRLLNGNERILKCLKFDSQKERQLQLIEENKKRILEIENKMDEGISPYHWRIIKDFNGYYDMKHHIKADYLLVLDT